MEQQTGSKLGKEYVKAVYCHPAYLTYMQSVRERLTRGFLRAVSHKPSIPYQFLATGTSEMARCSQDGGHRIKHMHESPSVNILLMTKLLGLDLLS